MRTAVRARQRAGRGGVAVDHPQASRDATDDVLVKLAARHGVNAVDLSVAAWDTWHRGFVDERDRRVSKRVAAAGELSTRSLQAHRGHVTRELLDELLPILEEA
jgi:hypothetical protein